MKKTNALNSKQSKQKAITLIALIITIIVMLILVGVTVTVALNGGLFNITKEASNKTTQERVKEQIYAAYSEWQAEVYAGTIEDSDYYTKDEIELNKNGIVIIAKLSDDRTYVYNIKTGSIVDVTDKESISKSTGENFVGYYADIDADGEIDGVIFADLLVGNTKGTQWGNTDGAYTIPTVESNDLRDYYISKEDHEGDFGTKDVISPKSTTGTNRFYIMSLVNFESSYTTYYWYANAYNKMQIHVTRSEFGTGNTNTKNMIEKWNLNGKEGPYIDATQHNQDIWKHIQTIYKEGWFIPSRAEWAAFANELGVTKDNYNSTYGLNFIYWTSSQKTIAQCWRMYFSDGKLEGQSVTWQRAVRLATTF